MAAVQALGLPFVQLHELRDGASSPPWRLAVSEAPAAGADGDGHRLLVLLDGNLSAVPAALMLQARAERAGGAAVRSTVVGIGYPGERLYDHARRARDYLPPLPLAAGAQSGTGGQADAFSRFLDDGLLPWLQARQGAPFTEIGLFGHSYGGLFVLYKLLHQPGPFRAFFSISPSLWWADGWLLDRLAGAADAARGRTLFLGIGADERARPGDDAERAALHRERDVQARFDRLVAELQGRQVAFRAERFAGEDHGSVVYPAIGRAMRWLMQPPHDGRPGDDPDPT